MLIFVLFILTWVPARPLQSVDADPEVRRLIASIASVEAIGRRIELVSEQLLGRPYLTRPLIGSPTTREALVSRVDGFDCVTFVETVLALASVDSAADFTHQLAAIRYRDAEIAWANRLHYATEWSAYQIGRGLLADITNQPESLWRQKDLHRVKGLPPRLSTYRYYPKRAYSLIAPTLTTGDIIFFVSGSPGLDTNHLGIVIRRGDQLWLRNASRRQRLVVDEPLEDYFRHNRMAGFFINRPRPRTG
ncbi:MAG: N-acetylmuramoyl-L-alanine amidase-like domain-containing protein [Acidobacteriota bacterium]|jgi:hypothetical protein